MKYSKRYITFTILLIISLVFKFNSLAEKFQETDSFRGASLDSETWNPLIAGSVNDNLLSVVIDNKEYTNESYHFYMDDNLNIMIPVAILRDAFNCSAHVYDSDTLMVEKYNSRLLFLLNQNRIEVNGREEAAISPFTSRGNEYYVSLNTLTSYLNYSYSWNIQENQAVFLEAPESQAVLPTRYDLRERYRVSDVRNQGSYGTCWSFAALSAMESVLLPEESLQFSVDHMTMCNGFRLSQQDGGDYTMAMAYLASWTGPVYEKDDPYGDGVTDKTLIAVKHVQEMQIIDGKDYEKIKEAVFKYGGVQTSIYNALRNSTSKSEYFNSEANAYCYIGTEKPNHDVIIIGWDDTYSKEHFKADLEGDGAFICQNSWGPDFGEEGIFYISYYDTNIGTHNVVYTEIEDANNYDHIYQSDLCGWVGQMGYNKESVFGANVFTAESDEMLSAAGFYATGKNSEYELYVVKNFEDISSLDNRVPVASGKLSNAGYYTVDFNQGVPVEEGERYAIVLHMITPGAVHPLAIEYAADEITKDVILTDGEGYISPNGDDWEDAGDVEECNLCIKAFSKNR